MDLKRLDDVFEFSGVKIALVCQGKVLTTLRDDIPVIPFPNTWDLPGGGREDNETPYECMAREVYEELGIRVAREDVFWMRIYEGMVDPTQKSVFMIGNVTQEQVSAIIFGDEGQGYKLESIEAFLSDKSVIPQLRKRMADYYY